MSVPGLARWRVPVAVGARAALGLSAALLMAAMMGWAPVQARLPVPLAALRLVPLVLVLAAATALLGQPRSSAPRLGRWLALWLASAGALALLVWQRGPAGLAGVVGTKAQPAALRVSGAVDLAGSDLAALPAGRLQAVWDGELRLPRAGPYRFWLDGEGTLAVELDGRPLLAARGAPARAATVMALLPGTHRLRVEASGRALRARLGWNAPTRAGRAGSEAELLPARFLGPARPAWLWWATDLLAGWLSALGGLLLFLAPWERPRELGVAAAPTRREWLAALAGHATLALLLTWPLARDLAGQGPFHRPDGRLNAWILGWNAQALLSHPATVFQAPVFHPLPDALAFTENLLLPALLVAPATRLAGPALGYNLLFLASIVSAALGAQALARRFCGDPRAAFVAGALFSLGAWRFANWAHLHAHATLFFPWALLALERFFERRSAARALAVGLLVALQALCSVYLGAIQGLAVAVVACVRLLRERDALGLLRLLGAGLLGTALLAPVFLPYFRMRAFQGVEFTLEDVRAYATTPESYLASGSRLWAPLAERHLPPERVHDQLFPGLLTLLLGLAGLAAAPRRPRAALLAAALVAVLISLGPETAVYRFLHAHIVPLRALRALGRFALVPSLALAVFAGCALAGRSRRWLAAALALALLENARWPARLEAFTPPGPAARSLAGGRGAVLALPLGENDTQVMLDGLAHLRPVVNGDSGFVPRPYARLAETLGDTAWDERLRLLRALGVTQVLARELLPLPLAARLDGQGVYDVPEGEAARVPQAGQALRLADAHLGWRVDLGEVRPVQGLVFELDDRPWVHRPVVKVSADGAEWLALPARASLADATWALYRDPARGRAALRFGARARLIELPAELPLRGAEVYLLEPDSGR